MRRGRERERERQRETERERAPMRACSACIRALCSSAGCVLRCNISAWYIIASGVLCCNATPHRMARRCCLMYQYTPHVSLSSLPQWDPVWWTTTGGSSTTSLCSRAKGNASPTTVRLLRPRSMLVFPVYTAVLFVGCVHAR